MKMNKLWITLAVCGTLSACTEAELAALFDLEPTPVASNGSTLNPTPQNTPSDSTSPANMSQDTWEYVDFEKSFERYFILNSQTIWGGTRNYNVLNGGSISASQDQGQTWSAQTPTGLANIQSIQFSDANQGWCIGSAESFGIAMYIGQTADGGNTWNERNDAFLDSKKEAGYSRVNSPLYLLSVIDAEQAYVGESQHLWSSSNQGKSWRELKVPDFEAEPEGDRAFTELKFFASGEGRVATYRHLYLSSNQGNSWVKKTNPWPALPSHGEFDQLLKVYFRTPDHGLAAVKWKNGTDSATGIYRSLNGGMSWELMYISKPQEDKTSSTPELKIGTFYFLNDNEGWVGGAHDFIAKTQDGGRSWTVVNDTGKNRRIVSFYPSLGEAKLLASTDSAGYWSLNIN